MDFFEASLWDGFEVIVENGSAYVDVLDCGLWNEFWDALLLGVLGLKVTF